MNYILAIDQGTHASRAFLFDQHGQSVASNWCDVSLLRQGEGRVEQNPAELLASVHQVVTELLGARDSRRHPSVTACGVCTQRSTVVACHKSGKAVSPAISWQDVRGATFLGTVHTRHEEIQQLSGLPISAHYGASKLHWLRQHILAGNPQDQICLAPWVSFLLLNILDQHPYYVDHSNAQRTQLMDLRTLDWSEQLLSLFKIPVHSLPAIRPIVFDYGTLMDTQIPVTAVCGDQNAAMFGAGGLPVDTALINLGSGAFVLRRLSKQIPSRQQLSGISYSDASTVHYLREGTINGAGTALTWANKQFKLGDLKQWLPGWLETVREPPVFINTIGGLGSPWWQPELEPQWVGAIPESKPEIAVSVIESITFLVQDNLTLMQQEKPIYQLRVSGGLSQLDGLCQKLANLSGLPVERMDNPQATARGIAWLAAGRPGHWQQTATKLFKSQQDAGLNKRYHTFCKRLARLIRDNAQQ